MDTMKGEIWKRVTIGSISLMLVSCSASYQKPIAPALDDRADHGSSFEAVLEVLKANPYDRKNLPVRRTSTADILSPQLLADSGRTLDSPADLRAPFRRILHPNGVCLAGEWIVEKPNPYSGLFKAGTRFPIIVRVSPPNDGLSTRRFHPQSVGLVGKIFPAADQRARVKTANFITQTDLGGFVSSKSKILDSSVVMSNAPGVTAVNRGIEVAAFGLLGNVLDRVDLMKTQRQLYPLAEAGKSGEPTRTPRFMRLSLSPSLNTGGDGTGQDLRLEFWEYLSRGKPLVYDIKLSDEGEVTGPAFLQRSWIKWGAEPVGRIEFTEAILSEACDTQIHFRHPPWREAVYDPKSSLRSQHGVAFGQPLLQDQAVLHGELSSGKGIAEVFEELNDIKAWPAWGPTSPVRSAKELSGSGGLVDLSLSVGGELIRSRCRRESEANTVVSLSCRDQADTGSFSRSPVQHDLSFLLSELPDGRTRINWGLLIRSKNVLRVRDAAERELQSTLLEHFRTP